MNNKKSTSTKNIFNIITFIIIISFLIAPTLSADEINSTAVISLRLDALKECLIVNTFLQGQIKKMSEDIDSFEKEDLIKIIELSEVFSDFIEKENNLDPVEDKKLYQANLNKLINKYKNIDDYMKKK